MGLLGGSHQIRGLMGQQELAREERAKEHFRLSGPKDVLVPGGCQSN